MIGNDSIGARVLACARGWLGTPYRHQSACKGAGTDCLGLVRGIWREIYGAEAEMPPPYSMDWGEAGGEEHLRTAAVRWLLPVQIGRAHV